MNDSEPTSVLVTGASSGIGEATVRALVGAGNHVVALARRKDRLQSLTDELGPSVLPVAADVSDSAEVASAVANLTEPFDRISALVNNAGLSKGFGPIAEADIRNWDEMIDTNVRGVLHCIDAVLPVMTAVGGGHIINLGSVAASYPYMGGNVYAASKAFVRQLSLNLRCDLQSSGIRVTCIDPGMTQTEFALVRFEGDANRANQLYEGLTPLSAEDVAESVRWCLAQPAHVNINLIELMPSEQPFGLGFRAPTPNKG